MTGLQIFTLFHVALSLIGIGAGFLVLLGFLRGALNRTLNLVFLVTTALTSVTGFFFPFHGVTPGIVLGVVSLIVFIPAWLGYQKLWMKTYIATAAVLQFLNVLVLIVQSFQKIPALHQLAPTGKEPIVAAVQLVALLLIIAMAVMGIRHQRAAVA